MKFFEKKTRNVLQGHTSPVLNLTVTSDDKYIISVSEDNTISIWNFLERRQETVLQGHTSSVWAVAVTNDNKYVISGSDDKTIKIWNLLQKREEEFSKFDALIKSLEVDTEYILTIYLDSGQIKTINLNNLI